MIIRRCTPVPFVITRRPCVSFNIQIMYRENNQGRYFNFPTDYHCSLPHSIPPANTINNTLPPQLNEIPPARTRRTRNCCETTAFAGVAVKKRHCRFGNEPGVIRPSLTRSNYSVEQKQLITASRVQGRTMRLQLQPTGQVGYNRAHIGLTTYNPHKRHDLSWRRKNHCVLEQFLQSNLVNCVPA